MNDKKRLLITSALPYANGPIHIGHLAGAYLTADIFARFNRLKNKDVVFICGSDEHGAAITLRAKKEGVTPQEIVDKYHTINKQAFENIGISFDMFHRTSDALHHKTSQDFFLQLEHNEAFTKQTTEQFYDEDAKQFLADRYILGTCPKCQNENAYGDQCEKCGSTLSPDELINPRSAISGNTPVKKETSHWFLPMERHEAWLKEWLENGVLDGKKVHEPKNWKPQVLGQCKSWIDGGLRPRAMTRDLDWGVKVPLPNAEGKVLYVWLDAPIGYISATKAWASENNKKWEDYWQSEDAEMVNFIGKDNIVFHCIIFPILLKLHGGYNLPENVPANEFLNLEGQKLSTSRNWAVWLHEYLEELPGKEDELRYVLTSIAPELRDSEFVWKDFQERVNNELVAVLGNFVNRALVLTHKYYDGVVPALGTLTEYDKEVLETLSAIPAKIEAHITAHRYRDALQEAMGVARLGNKYLADTEPWKTVKTDPERVQTIMHIALQICGNLSIVLQPFLPFTVQKLTNMLGVDTLAWEKAGTPNLIAPSHTINKAELLFAKIEDEMIEQQVEKLKNNTPQTVTIEPQKEATQFEDFLKMDIRVATIETAEKVKKSKKLIQMTVNTGMDTRTVVSGIAEHYSPEELIGKQVSILANLAPRKIMGIESQGMILLAEDSNGKLTFVIPDDAVNNGSIVR